MSVSAAGIPMIVTQSNSPTHMHVRKVIEEADRERARGPWPWCHT
jgi:hypothetical protein